MKKLHLAIALALGLAIPFSVFSTSDVDINKHAMEMHEKSTESVMNRVQLPEDALDKVAEEANFKKRFTEKQAGDVQAQGKGYAGEEIPGNKYAGDTSADGLAKKLKKQTGKAGSGLPEEETPENIGQGTGEGVGDLDRDRIRDQDQLEIHDRDQDQDRDRDQDRTMELDQDQIRDTDKVFDQDPQPEQHVDDSQGSDELQESQVQNETEDPGSENEDSGSENDSEGSGSQQGN